MISVAYQEPEIWPIMSINRFSIPCYYHNYPYLRFLISYRNHVNTIGKEILSPIEWWKFEVFILSRRGVMSQNVKIWYWKTFFELFFSDQKCVWRARGAEFFSACYAQKYTISMRKPILRGAGTGDWSGRFIGAPIIPWLTREENVGTIATSLLRSVSSISVAARPRSRSR